VTAGFSLALVDESLAAALTFRRSDRSKNAPGSLLGVGSKMLIIDEAQAQIL
jgi:hypothetical protein